MARFAVAVLCGLFACVVGAATYDVAAYVWPAYQPEPRWAELGIFGEGIGEWQNVKEAVPKWPGHRQPPVPLWGYENEADPKVMERKIDAAVSHGVNTFIYDWYWYGGRPFLEESLDKGFLGASNNGKMKFFIMWANHDVNGYWNNKAGKKSGKDKVIWQARVSDDDWRQMVDRWIAQYFSRPNYYRIGGKPALSIYDVKSFIEWDGLDTAKARIAYLRERARAAGFPGLHLQVICGSRNLAMSRDLSALGVDSATCYCWIDGTCERLADRSLPELTYAEWGELALKMHDSCCDAAKSSGMAYFPNISIGWDNNARYPACESKRVVRNSNPADFERYARRIKAWADANIAPSLPRLITVNSWNEWTEGSYLEPDTLLGFGYLEAVRKVFGTSETKPCAQEGRGDRGI